MKFQLVLLAAFAAVAIAAPNDPSPPQPGDVCGLCKAVVEQLGDEETLVCLKIGYSIVVLLYCF